MSVSLSGGVSLKSLSVGNISIPGLFRYGEQGAWYEINDTSTLFQTETELVPVTALGQDLGRINDKSGNGNYAYQPDAGKMPVYEALSAVLGFEASTSTRLQYTFVDDPWYGLYSTQAMIWNGPTGLYTIAASMSPEVQIYKAELVNGERLPSLEFMALIILDRDLNVAEELYVREYLESFRAGIPSADLIYETYSTSFESSVTVASGANIAWSFGSGTVLTTPSVNRPTASREMVTFTIDDPAKLLQINTPYNCTGAQINIDKYVNMNYLYGRWTAAMGQVRVPTSHPSMVNFRIFGQGWHGASGVLPQNYSSNIIQQWWLINSQVTGHDLQFNCPAMVRFYLVYSTGKITGTSLYSTFAGTNISWFNVGPLDNPPMPMPTFPAVDYPNLSYTTLRGDNFTGTIPNLLEMIRDVPGTEFRIENCPDVTGTIPSLDQVPQQVALSMGNMPGLTGPIPPTNVNLNLNYVSLGSCAGITGAVPDTSSNINMSGFYLDNMPAVINCPAGNLLNANLSGIQFTGTGLPSISIDNMLRDLVDANTGLPPAGYGELYLWDTINPLSAAALADIATLEARGWNVYSTNPYSEIVQMSASATSTAAPGPTPIRMREMIDEGYKF